LQQVRVAELQHLTALTMPEKDREETKVKEAAKVFDAAFKEYLNVSGDLAEPALIAQLKSRIATFHENRSKFFQMSNSAAGAEIERAQEAREYFNGDDMQAYLGVDAAVRQLRVHHIHQADAAKALGAAAAASATRRLLGVGAAICVLSILLATYITRRVTRQLGGEPGHVAYIAQRIADGDLCVPIPVKARGKANVMTAMEAMQGHLRELIGAVQQAADGILVGTREIAAGNHDLSGRTEQQAASLQETTSSVASIDDTVRRGTERAKETTAMTRKAFQSAEAGGATMVRVVATMSEISTKSQRVSDILGVIDGIATQTHILALNASVEAARAGTQGLGFAVVANEVRSLAHRCAEASREIRSLIAASVETVGEGSELVQAANADIARIVNQVRHIDQLVGEMHTTSTDQYGGIGRIKQTITTLEKTAHQNAALVEESAAAAALLTSQAQRLVAATSRFKVVETEAA
jgi:methyl-accepting chemotaxis protein